MKLEKRVIINWDKVCACHILGRKKYFRSFLLISFPTTLEWPIIYIRCATSCMKTNALRLRTKKEKKRQKMRDYPDHSASVGYLFSNTKYICCACITTKFKGREHKQPTLCPFCKNWPNVERANCICSVSAFGGWRQHTTPLLLHYTSSAFVNNKKISTNIGYDFNSVIILTFSNSVEFSMNFINSQRKKKTKQKWCFIGITYAIIFMIAVDMCVRRNKFSN